MSGYSKIKLSSNQGGLIEQFSGNTDQNEQVAQVLTTFSNESMEKALPGFVAYLSDVTSAYSTLGTDTLTSVETAMGYMSDTKFENMMNFIQNPRTKHISIETVFENASIENDQDRIHKAEALLGRELTVHQKEGILHVHKIFQDKGVFELSPQEGAVKLLKLMREYGFSKEEAFKLCDYGICGVGKFLGKLVTGSLGLTKLGLKRGGIILFILAYYGTGIYGKDFIEEFTSNNEIMTSIVYAGTFTTALFLYTLFNARVLGGEGGLKALNKAMQRNNKLLLVQSFLTGSHAMARYSEDFDLFTKNFGEMPLIAGSIIPMLFVYYLVSGQDRQGAGGIAEKSQQN